MTCPECERELPTTAQWCACGWKDTTTSTSQDVVYVRRGEKRVAFSRCVWRYRQQQCPFPATSHMGNGPQCQYHEFLGRQLKETTDLKAEKTLFDEWWVIRYPQDDVGKDLFWHRLHHSGQEIGGAV